MSRVRLSADGCLEPRPCFAGLDALVPRVMELCVTSSSAVSEPRTTATAATDFSRFRDRAAFGAYQTDCRGRGCSSGYTGIWLKHTRKEKRNNRCSECARMYLHGFSLGLTCASLKPLKPPVASVPVADTSAILKPSTTRSATTGPAGFLERTALWARHLIARGDGERSRVEECVVWRADYQLPFRNWPT